MTMDGRGLLPSRRWQVGTLTVVLMLFSLAQDRWQKTLSPLVGLGKQEIAHILVDFLRGNTPTETAHHGQVP